MAADGRAKAIVDNGFTSRHAVASLGEDDLRGMGFLSGHARILAGYLAAANVADGPAAPMAMAAADAITAARAAAQQGAAMVAAAVIDGQRPLEFNGGSSGRPSVTATIKFIETHTKKPATARYCLAPIVKKILDDPRQDIDADVIAEPALSSDQHYYRVVVASLSMDQLAKYGGNETKSASKLLQNILCSVAECDVDHYVGALTEFKEFGGTETLNGIKSRFGQFVVELNEVRYHSLFKLENAIKKI